MNSGARVRALLRRPRLYIDQEPTRRKACCSMRNRTKPPGKDAHCVWLPKEFDLLSRLVQESPRVISKKELAETVWETSLEQALHHRTIDVHIHRIRHKLGGAAACVC